MRQEDDMGLQDKLDALKLDFETNMAPPGVPEVLHRAIDELIADGAPERALKAGDRAPAFVLKDADGVEVDSARLLAKGPLVVSFYRGVWCPYCNLELQALEEARAGIEARGASLLAISLQTAANSRKSRQKNGLGFPILVDAGGKIASAFRLTWIAPDYLRDLQTKLGADVAAFNGDSSWMLPMPARYVIGQDGVIAYAEVNADYTIRPEPADLYPVLDRLGRAAA